MKRCYVAKRFSAGSLAITEQANQIITTYAAQGYDLTLRQLYYQFVSRDLIANKQTEYKRLGGIINDARLAGLIDWDAITDRTRNLKQNGHWSSPASIVDTCARTFQYDKWEGQANRVEVWIEKDALAGVFDRVCSELDVPYFSCRGYTSQSEMFVASQRHISRRHFNVERPDTTILHFGDHDPSGIDMSRDIEDRLNLFAAGTTVKRIALTMTQIRRYDPPPNPAKDTDSRFTDYLNTYGDECWELDALEPQVLAALVQEEVIALRDEEQWNAMVTKEKEARAVLAGISENWGAVNEFIDDLKYE